MLRASHLLDLCAACGTRFLALKSGPNTDEEEDRLSNIRILSRMPKLGEVLLYENLTDFDKFEAADFIPLDMNDPEDSPYLGSPYEQPLGQLPAIL
jgi:hypothetical protein